MFILKFILVKKVKLYVWCCQVCSQMEYFNLIFNLDVFGISDLYHLPEGNSSSKPWPGWVESLIMFVALLCWGSVLWQSLPVVAASSQLLLSPPFVVLFCPLLRCCAGEDGLEPSVCAASPESSQEVESLARPPRFSSTVGWPGEVFGQMNTNLRVWTHSHFLL